MNGFGLLANLNFQIGGVTIAPSFIQAAVVIIVVFLVILFMARITRTYIGWYTSGWYIWVILGFILAVVIEGVMFISGSTIFTSVLGWQSAPKPIQQFVDSGRAKLIQVLGAQDDAPTARGMVSDFDQLDKRAQEEVKERICK